MTLGSCSLRVSPRLPANYFKPRAATRHLLYYHGSSTLQRWRTGHTPAFGVIGTAAPSIRSYWWSSLTLKNSSVNRPLPSSSGVTEPVAAKPIPPTVVDPPTTSIAAGPPQLPAVDPIDPSVGFDPFNHLPAPLEYGDLASLGLTSYFPPGLVNWSLEIVHFSTGLPWLYTIIAGTIVWRAALGYFQMIGMKYAALMRIHAPTINNAKKDMEELKKNKSASAVDIQTARQNLQKAYASSGINITKVALIPFAQIPIVFGMFLGVRNLCSAHIVELQNTGSWLIPDLTAVSGSVNWDPYYCLPAMMWGAVIYQMRLSQKENTSEATATTGHVLNLVQLCSPLMFYIFTGFPAGLIVSAITGVGYSVVQSQILRLPTIRKKMGLPYLTKQDPPKFRESVLWAKEKFQDMQKTVEQKSKEDLARRRKEQIRKDAATEMEAMKRLGGRRNLL